MKESIGVPNYERMYENEREQKEGFAREIKELKALLKDESERNRKLSERNGDIKEQSDKYKEALEEMTESSIRYISSIKELLQP